MGISYLDTHCHLDMLSDPESQILNASKKGVDKIIVPAVDRNNFFIVKEMASKFENVFYSLGIHPCRVNQVSSDDLLFLDNLLSASSTDPKLVAIGEIGLDFFLKNLDKGKMEKIYIQQLKLAKKFSLPVLLHVRKSQDLILKYFKMSGVNSGIAHAFNGSNIQAKNFIKNGLLLGFGGAMTYERSLQIRRLATNIPDNAFVIETDSPDLSPSWRRNGQENSPAEIPLIASCLASLRGVSTEKIATLNYTNAIRALPKLSLYARYKSI